VRVGGLNRSAHHVAGGGGRSEEREEVEGMADMIHDSSSRVQDREIQAWVDLRGDLFGGIGGGRASHFTKAILRVYFAPEMSLSAPLTTSYDMLNMKSLERLFFKEGEYNATADASLPLVTTATATSNKPHLQASADDVAKVKAILRRRATQHYHPWVQRRNPSW
jgi:hypothetical protein